MEALLIILAAALLGVLGVLGGFLLRDAPITSIRLRAGAQRLHPGDRRVRRAFEVLTQTTLERGNAVELLENGEQLFPRLLADLASARELITWQVFWFRSGRLAQTVSDALIERAQAGVEVLVLLDYFGSLGLDARYVTRLRAGGVRVEVFRPLRWKSLYKAPHRSHVRSVVIDGRVGYTGGFGIDDQWLGDGRSPGQWRDTHVRIEGPVVDQLQAPFIANWAECTGELLFGRAVMEASEVARGDSMCVAVMYASPSLGSTCAERLLVLTISAARESLGRCCAARPSGAWTFAS